MSFAVLVEYNMNKKRLVRFSLAAIMVILVNVFVLTASAQEEDSEPVSAETTAIVEEAPDLAANIAYLTGNLDTVWMLVAAFLVFWMQAGFALVEAGFVRAKNITNILMKNLFDF